MRILYCVLNWGLGHATRSIPVIKALQAEGHTVEIASDGGPLAFLQKTFPECTSHEFTGYDIQYPTQSVFLNVVSWSYKILRAIYKEHQQIERLMQEHSYNAVISDNRYGCYHTSIPSILITHQLSHVAKSDILSKPGEWSLHRFFKKFNEIWIPDTPDRALSGKLTECHLQKIRFIGHLSDQVYVSMPKQYNLTAILSGPEPQRTKLEQEVLAQLYSLPGNYAIVQGIINDATVRHEQNVSIYSYLDRGGINAILNSSEIILCRSGYSSLMDLLKVGAKAILIPTPGQPEQQYLGERLKDHRQFVVQKQGELDVAKAMQVLQTRQASHSFQTGNHLLPEAIHYLQSRIL